MSAISKTCGYYMYVADLIPLNLTDSLENFLSLVFACFQAISIQKT